MDLVVVAVGKLKDDGLEGLCRKYEERSRSMMPISRVVTRDAGGSWAQAEKIGGPVVVLDERGEQIDTETLAAWLGRWRDDGVRRVSFLIGDAHGFADADRKRADKVLALSKLTLPHRLAQVFLVEQLYRAGCVLVGHPYHHG